MSTRWVRVLPGLLLAAAALALGGRASAQEPTAEPARPVETAAPPAATAEPPPATAAPVQAPAATPPPAAAEPADAGATPWPWPFPWMQEAAQQKAEAEGAAAASGTVAPDASGPRVVPGAIGGPLDTVRRAVRPGAEPIAAEVPASEPVAPPSAPDPASSQTPALPAQTPAVPAPTISPKPTSSHTCEYKAVENGVTGDVGAILQVAVRYDDCTWGASQVLISYEIRGPPEIAVLAQSAGLFTEIEAFVTREKVRLGMAYEGRDGEPHVVSPASVGPASLSPLASDPVSEAMQRGDNLIEIAQDVDTTSGDAVSGSQRLSLHVEGDAASIHVLAQNAAAGASAVSGDSDSDNAIVGRAGPEASGEGAQSGQVGDNDVLVDQDALARTGNAVAGSQDIAVRVTGSVGELGIMAQNASPDAAALSGNATATNDVVVGAGPSASADDGAALAGQVGDNSVDVGQLAHATSGDALAGAQVIDVVIGGSVGDLSVMAANASDDALAVSGDAIARNTADVLAGPDAQSLVGDAVAAQIGDNDVLVAQTALARSGLAAAGSQVIRILVGGAIGRTAVLPTNASDDASAFSGIAEATNVATGALGPQAGAGDGDAMTQQDGSNDLVVDQIFDAASGDAVAGGTVAGLVETVPSAAVLAGVTAAAVAEPVLIV